MSSTNYTIIRNAILNKQQIIATYGGHVREMCPHAIGHKKGVEQALFFQFAGGSSKGQITHDTKDNWRCLTISSLTNISVRNGDWHTFGNHSISGTCLDIIDVETPY